MEHIELLTFIYHGIDFNFFSFEDIIEWCDKQILAQENPDYWLIEMSCLKKMTFKQLKRYY